MQASFVNVVIPLKTNQSRFVCLQAWM